MQEKQIAAAITPKQTALGAPVPPNIADVIALVIEVAARYQITAIQPLLRVCQAASVRAGLSVAVLGRFKAGKSSFLNHFIGWDLLPVGVIPVTSVITEVLWGERQQVEVHFLDGRTERTAVEALGEFVTETNNPENRKQVSSVVLCLPELAPYKGLRFIDTPGLESAFAHNTETSLTWIPNVDLALVAIGVDPPLSQQDVTLIRKLFEYTPKVCVLLTKVDVLTEREREEVLQFVRTQLNRNFANRIEVFPYSVRPGFDELKFNLEQRLLRPALKTIHEEKEEILSHKIKALLQECGDYVRLTLRSAEMIDADKQRLRERAFDEREGFSDSRLELQLIARHSIGIARYHVEKTLAPSEKLIQHDLAIALEREFPVWKISFAALLNRFEAWLSNALRLHLLALSESQKAALLTPVQDVQRQYLRVLQASRDRLSARTMELFGVPLRTTETAIEPDSPKAPDINVGRMFDHNWELLSPIIPMTIMRPAVKTRFLGTVDYETTKNLSRLTTQWADILTGAVVAMQREAEHRWEELLKTVELLTAVSSNRAPEIRSDLDRLRRAQADFKA